MIDDETHAGQRYRRRVREHTPERHSGVTQLMPKVFLIAKVVMLTGAACLTHLSSAAQSISGHVRVPASAVPIALAPETALSMKHFTYGQPITVSHDGRYLAYVWEDPAKSIPEAKMIRSSSGGRFLSTGAPWLSSPIITVRDLQSGIDTVIHGANSAWAPAWSPTSDTLAFMSDRDGTAGLWVWSPTGHGAARRITATPLTTAYYGGISWTSNGRSIVLASPWQAFAEAKLHTRRTEGPKLANTNAVDVEVQRSGFRAGNLNQDGAGKALSTTVNKLPGFESALVRVDLDNGTAHVLASGTGVDWMQPSPDGRWIAYTTLSDYERPGGRRYQSYYDLWIQPLSGGVRQKLAADVPLNLRGPLGISWSPDSRHLAYRKRGLPAEEALFIVGIDGTAPKSLAKLADAGYYYTPVWGADSSHLFMWQENELFEIDIATGENKLVCRLSGKRIRLLLNRGGATNTVYSAGKDNGFVLLATDESAFTSGFYRVTPSSGEIAVLKEESRAFGGGYIAELCIAAASRGDTVVFTSEGASEPEELWTTDGTFQKFKRASDLAGDIWKVSMGSLRIAQWTGPSGVPARGALLLPPNYDPSRRYPLVIWMYEHSLTKANTFGLTGQSVFNCQLLATRGIACLYPDLTWQREKVMQGLHEQVSAAIKGLVDQGIADSERIGVEGQSSGGYDTFAVVATTPSIKAAVACSGLVDMMMAYQDHNGQWVESQMGLGGAPWEYPERYIANSPSFHMDRIQSPILIVQGTGDKATTQQMDLAFDLLKHLGRDVEYRRYAGEGHAPDTWRMKNQLDATKRMLEWWLQYLSPQAK